MNKTNKVNLVKVFCSTVFLLSLCMESFAQKVQIQSVFSEDTSKQESAVKVPKSAVRVIKEEYLLHNDDPDWEWVYNEFSRKYPDSNLDSLTHFAKAQYFREVEGDKRKEFNELAYLANTYGDTWTPGELALYARTVIREVSGFEKDALKWSRLAMEKTTDETEKKDLGITYAYVLAKLGKKKEALEYVAEALSIFPPDKRYLNVDGTTGYGLGYKQTMSDLFEIEADRAVWAQRGSKENQKEARYRGKVFFEEDKQYWEKVRDKYLVKQFTPQAADSVMLLGARYYYESYLNDTIVGMAPFVEYSEKYNNRTNNDLNNNAWEVFKKSKKQEELRRALKWSEESFKDKQHLSYKYETYANLWYKLGDIEKAFKYMKKAQALVSDTKRKDDYQQVLEKMKKGESTW